MRHRSPAQRKLHQKKSTKPDDSRQTASRRGFVMAVAVASCCAFASPVTYQTHLIVYGPGGYRFTDFVKVGLPLDLLTGAVAIAVIPSIWPFQ